MINISNGQIELNNSIVLKPNSKLNQIQHEFINHSIEITDMKTGWVWLSIKNYKIQDLYYIISLAFNLNNLKQIDLIFDSEIFDLDDNWNNWSEQTERNNVRRYEAWIRNEIGEKRKFQWGDVWVGYDEKSAQSLITISYK